MAKKENVPAVPAVIENFAIMAYTPEEFALTMRENLGQGDALSINDLQRIKIPTGGSTVWQVPSISGKPQNEEELEGVILYWHRHRAYWEKGMDQGGKSAPDCSSPDGLIGRVNPESGAADRGQGGDCSRCPLAQFGSAADGRRQACKDQRRVFLLRPGRMLPSVVNLAPTSASVMKAFLTNLTGENIPYFRCVIGMSLEQDVSANNVDYAKVKFRVKNVMTAEEYEALRPFREQMLPYLKTVELTDEDR
jgi:hypothetical protein